MTKLSIEDRLCQDLSGDPPRGVIAINALEKDLAVLEALSGGDGPHRLDQIATRARLGKPTVHRILQDLVRVGYANASAGGYYEVGPRLVAMASMAIAEDRQLHDVVNVLESLRDATGQTIHMAVRSGDEAVYVHKINSDQPYRMRSRVGMRLPLYSTAVGKAILAWLDPGELGAVLDRTEFVARTPKTIRTRAALLAELERVRAQGFAVDDEENELNVRCVGVPVFDRHHAVFGGVSVSSLVYELTLEQAAALAPQITRAVNAITER